MGASSSSTAQFQTPCQVNVHSLNARSDLNGRRGLANRFDAQTERYLVTIDGSGEQVSLRAANLRPGAVEDDLIYEGDEPAASPTTPAPMLVANCAPDGGASALMSPYDLSHNVRMQAEATALPSGDVDGLVDEGADTVRPSVEAPPVGDTCVDELPLGLPVDAVPDTSLVDAPPVGIPLLADMATPGVAAGVTHDADADPNALDAGGAAREEAELAEAIALSMVSSGGPGKCLTPTPPLTYPSTDPSSHIPLSPTPPLTYPSTDPSSRIPLSPTPPLTHP